MSQKYLNEIEIMRQLLGQQNNISVPKLLIRLFDNPTDAIVFAQLVFWSDKSARTDDYFYKSGKELSEETGLSEDQIDRSIKRLMKFDFVDCKKKRANGAPTRHFHICLETCLQALSLLVSAESRNGNRGIAESDSAESRKHKQIQTQLLTTDINMFADENFEKLYKSWHKKANKPAAKKAFNKLIAGKKPEQVEQIVEMIMTDAKKRLEGNQLGFNNMHLSSYINRQGWEDDLPNQQQANQVSQEYKSILNNIRNGKERSQLGYSQMQILKAAMRKGLLTTADIEMVNNHQKRGTAA